MAKIKVYFDNCAYNRPFDNLSQTKVALEADAKRHIQKLIVDKIIDLSYSYINRLENDDNPFKIRKISIGDFFKNAVSYVDSFHAEVIEDRAKSFMQLGLHSKDSLHLSCAIEDHCNYFITTDKQVTNFKCNEIIICNPLTFVDSFEEDDYA